MDEVKEKIRNHRQVAEIERDQFVALAAILALAAGTGRTAWIPGILAGGLLMALNFRMLRNIVELVIFRMIDGSGASAGGLVVRVIFKFLVLGGAIAALLWTRAVDLVPLVLGTTAWLLAVLWQAMKAMLFAPPLQARKG